MLFQRHQTGAEHKKNGYFKQSILMMGMDLLAIIENKR